MMRIEIEKIDEIRLREAAAKFDQLVAHFRNKYPLDDDGETFSKVVIAMQPGVVMWKVSDA